MPAFGVSNDIKTYEVVAYDKAGNESTKTFTIDTKKPIVVVNDTEYTGEESVNNFIDIGRFDSVNVNILEENIKYVNVWYNGVLQEDYLNVDYTQEGTYQIEVRDEFSNKTKIEFYVGKYDSKIVFSGLDNIFYDGNPVDDITVDVVDSEGNKVEQPILVNYYKDSYGEGNLLTGAPTDAGTYVIAAYYQNDTGDYDIAWASAEFTIVADTTKPDVGDLENNAIYFGNIPYYMTDENGIDYVYYDFSHNYTSCRQLIDAYNQGVIDRSDVGGLKAYPENGAGVYDVSWLPSDKTTGVSFCAVDKAGNDTFVGGITIYKNANATTVVEAINNGGNITIPSNVAPITISGNSLSIPANTYINGNNLLTIIDTLNIANDYITISYTNITGGINITGNYSSLENSVISGAIDIG